MTLSPLPTLMIEGPVRAALLEDLGRAGDVTSTATIPEGTRAKAILVTRAAGTMSFINCRRFSRMPWNAPDSPVMLRPGRA